MDDWDVTISAVSADPADLIALRYDWSGSAGQDPEFEQRLREWWETEQHHRRALVAHTPDGRPVGMANALVYSRMPSPGRPIARWLYAANVFVTPAARRRRVATALMTELIRGAHADGMVRVVLAPSEMSKPLYRSLGFRVADDLMRLDFE